MVNSWGSKSKAGYDTLHPDLKLLCDTVLVHHDCSILWGYRDEITQNTLYKNGYSKLKYPDSSHNKTPSEAVDLIPYRKGFNPYGTKAEQAYGQYFCGLVNGVASQLYREARLSYQIKWGGSWSVQRDKPYARFYDGFHWELSK